MDIEQIRTKARAGSFNITDHAMIESFKDGISINDILYCIEHGKVIEEYPNRKRYLIFSI